MSCYQPETGQRRLARDQHHRDCNASGCPGCKPCGERHCASCGHRHLNNSEARTCARCVGEIREDLDEIGRLCGVASREVQHRQVNSTVLMIAGPASDPETWNRRHRLVTSGAYCRCGPGACPDDQPIPHGPACHATLCAPDGKSAHQSCARIHGLRSCPTILAWLDDCRDERHPLFVLGTWDMLWREHLEHHTTDMVTIAAALAYLGQQLTYMAQQEEPDPVQFADEVQSCRSYLEDVLGEGERPERGAPCPACGKASLVKEYDDEDPTGSGDRWTCPKADCAQQWNEEDYRRKVDAVYVTKADRLTASQIRSTYRVPEGSVRAWASVGKVRRRGKDAQGLTTYDVADVLLMRGDAS